MTSEKLCFICKINPIENPKLISYCQACNRQKGKDNYYANKERYFANAKRRDDQIDELINSYKDRPCEDCGIKYPPYVMDLDHMAFNKITEEMNKCDVICANCHRERTNKQNPARYTKDLSQNAPGATCQH